MKVDRCPCGGVPKYDRSFVNYEEFPYLRSSLKCNHCGFEVRLDRTQRDDTDLFKAWNKGDLYKEWKVNHE